MTPINCRQCGRANSNSATRCIWCGLPMIVSEAPLRFEPMRVEVAYLDGIDRLDGPTPVSLEINSDGIEVAELMPGSRVVRIAAEELIEAKAFDASVAAENQHKSKRRITLAFRALLSSGKRRAQSHTNRREFLLTIKYKSEGGIRSAIFRREDEGGLAVIEKLSRFIAMLVEIKWGRY